MFDDIVREWEQWMGSPRAARTLARWANEQPALVGWNRRDLRWPVSSDRTDAMQAALVALAQAGEEQAVRTLIAQLNPGLTGLVWRAYNRESAGPRPFGSMKDAQREVLSAFGETVASHRLDRRPSRIAANLLLDTHQRLSRASEREHRHDRLPPPSVADAAANEPADLVDGAVDLAAAVSTALGQLPGTGPNRHLTAELAYRAWVLDEPSVAIARELGLGRKTVDTRLYRLRSAVRAAHTGRPLSQAVSRSDGSAPPSSPVGPSWASRQ